jgi:chromosome segregation ATPase
MSSPISKSPASAAEPASLRRELEEKNLLIQDIRRHLIQAQITILELHDTIMQKETDKADAISILGQLEHHLEEKVNYIMELDRVLNARITAGEQALAAEKAARESVTQDLVGKLDTANREIGAAHELAAGFARDLAETKARLQTTTDELASCRQQLQATTQQLHATAEARSALDREISTMRRTLSWRLTKPFRSLRRLFS